MPFSVIQAALFEMGCYNGAIDGAWSDATQKTVEHAARDLNLSIKPLQPTELLMDTLLRSQGGRCRSVPGRFPTLASAMSPGVVPMPRSMPTIPPEPVRNIWSKPPPGIKSLISTREVRNAPRKVKKWCNKKKIWYTAYVQK